jgi:Fur family transcriptional regulator, ferric uptake regulator
VSSVPPDADEWLELAGRRLRGAGLKSGAARNAVIEHLAREGGCLLSAQEIALGLREKGPGSNASVYRTLEQLTELGLVHRLDGADGVARYEVAHPDHHHHHFFDERTGEVVAFEDDGLEKAIADVAKRLGVELTSHDVILRGRSSQRDS